MIKLKCNLRLAYSLLFGSAAGSRRQNRTANQIQPVAEASFATATYTSVLIYSGASCTTNIKLS